MDKVADLVGGGSFINRASMAFLAALSSSRRLVVCWSVCLSVGLSVDWSAYVCEKVTLRVSDGYLSLPETYLLSYMTVVTAVTVVTEVTVVTVVTVKTKKIL